MWDRINQALGEIERSENVRIVYACGSGSRTWGFPSPDSDYDVRFLYARPEDWYFSLNMEDKGEVIERPVTDMLDLEGWDIRKAMRLLHKSNPIILEWLDSPIIYRGKPWIADKIRKLSRLSYSPTACINHYLSLAQGNYRENLQGDLVQIKKYFYVLRPLLAAKWVEAMFGMAPASFETMVDRLVTDQAVRNEIGKLIERKSAGLGLDREPTIPTLDRFIVAELERLETPDLNLPSPNPGYEVFDRVFRETVHDSWIEELRPPVPTPGS